MLYQITVFEPHKFFHTHVLVDRLVVSDNAFSICRGLRKHVSYRLCFTQNRRQLLPTSTEHWAVALANFSIGRTLPDIVATVFASAGDVAASPSTFSRWLHMIRDDYVSHSNHVSDTTVTARMIGPKDVQRMRIPPSSKNSWRTTLGFGANKASGAMASQQ